MEKKQLWKYQQFHLEIFRGMLKDNRNKLFKGMLKDNRNKS